METYKVSKKALKAEYKETAQTLFGKELAQLKS